MWKELKIQNAVVVGVIIIITMSSGSERVNPLVSMTPDTKQRVNETSRHLFQKHKRFSMLPLTRKEEMKENEGKKSESEEGEITNFESHT